MSDSEHEPQAIWVICAACGHNSRKHLVLHEVERRHFEEPGGPLLGIDYHRFVECMGCESLKYVTSSYDPEEPDPHYAESDFKVFPDAPGNAGRRASAISDDDALHFGADPLIPDNVWKMYKETLDAFNNSILTLAAGGLRATVEAICLDRGITDGSLQEKINELAARDLLTAAQADLLHEERYLGNLALHELETPSRQALEDGLGIVEGLMNTIYILPEKAKRLRNRRTHT